MWQDRVRRHVRAGRGETVDRELRERVVLSAVREQRILRRRPRDKQQRGAEPHAHLHRRATHTDLPRPSRLRTRNACAL